MVYALQIASLLVTRQSTRLQFTKEAMWGLFQQFPTGSLDMNGGMDEWIKRIAEISPVSGKDSCPR